jgi:hypothetical protein
MSAALGTYSALSISKPKRVEGSTTNVETPILYSQYITGTVGETTEAGDTYIIPHKFDAVIHVNFIPLSDTGRNFLFGGDGSNPTVGAFVADAATITGPTQITTAATKGASAVVLTSGSSINDVYNGCTVVIRFDNGNKQEVKITDYVGATTTATLADPLAQDIKTTGTYYTVKGTLLTTGTAAATPKVRYEVIGIFE